MNASSISSTEPLRTPAAFRRRVASRSAHSLPSRDSAALSRQAALARDGRLAELFGLSSADVRDLGSAATRLARAGQLRDAARLARAAAFLADAPVVNGCSGAASAPRCGRAALHAV